MNVQGSGARNELEDSLADAGFFLPFSAAERWYGNNSTLPAFRMSWCWTGLGSLQSKQFRQAFYGTVGARSKHSRFVCRRVPGKAN